MDKEYLKEKLSALRTEMNHLWTGMFITLGGAVGFCAVERINILIGTFIISGFILGVLFLNAYMVRRTELKDIIRILQKGEFE